MPGAKNADTEVSVAVGRAPPLVFVVPPQAGVYYIGTINLSCEDAMAYGESVRLICNEQAVHNEIKQASQVAQLQAFYPAEAYHQGYMERHPYQPYIVINDAPKVAHLKADYPALYRETPAQP